MLSTRNIKLASVVKLWEQEGTLPMPKIKQVHLINNKAD